MSEAEVEQFFKDNIDWISKDIVNEGTHNYLEYIDES